MKKVLFIDDAHPVLKQELESMGYQCDEFPGKSREAIRSIIADYTGIIIRSKVDMDQDMLQHAVKLKFIARVGAGMENIDQEYATSQNIICLNSPEGNRDAVGEHALGMLLSLLNHLNRADGQVKAGKWIREGNRGIEIKGKTIGIIGYGNMGSSFARKLSGFDVNVLAYDKYKTGFSDTYAEECSMDRIFAESDILSLHIPLTSETTYLVDRDYLSQFQKPIWLINTSRGMILKTEHLVEALTSGKVAGAALDVLEYEKTSFEEMLLNDLPVALQYLFRAENVILSPHIAGWTQESKYKLAKVLADKIRAIPETER
jgi:D-3-phosphoglycerate dehydrogenase / 2-oxoglutarate reductase